MYLCEDVTIKPQHEAILMVTVRGGEEGNEMQFELDMNIILEKSVLEVISTRRDKRLHNPSNVQVPFKNKQGL